MYVSSVGGCVGVVDLGFAFVNECEMVRGWWHQTGANRADEHAPGPVSPIGLRLDLRHGCLKEMAEELTRCRAQCCAVCGRVARLLLQLG